MRITTTSAILATLASLISAQSIDIPISIPNAPALIDVQALSSRHPECLASSAMIFDDAMDMINAAPIPQEPVTTSSETVYRYDGIHLPMAVSATTTPYAPIISTYPAAAPGGAPVAYWQAPQTAADPMPTTAAPVAGPYTVTEIVTVVQQIPNHPDANQITSSLLDSLTRS